MIEHKENRVFMCECCPTVLHGSEQVTNDYGERCCPISGLYVIRRAWDSDVLLSGIMMRYSPADEYDFGWCDECGDDTHPDDFIVDNFGDVVCTCNGVPLVQYDDDSQEYY